MKDVKRKQSSINKLKFIFQQYMQLNISKH